MRFLWGRYWTENKHANVTPPIGHSWCASARIKRDIFLMLPGSFKTGKKSWVESIERWKSLKAEISVTGHFLCWYVSVVVGHQCFTIWTSTHNKQKRLGRTFDLKMPWWNCTSIIPAEFISRRSTSNAGYVERLQWNTLFRNALRTSLFFMNGFMKAFSENKQSWQFIHKLDCMRGNDFVLKYYYGVGLTLWEDGESRMVLVIVARTTLFALCVLDDNARKTIRLYRNTYHE